MLRRRWRPTLAALCLGLVGGAVLLRSSSQGGAALLRSSSPNDRHAFPRMLRLSREYLASVRPYSTSSIVHTQQQLEGQDLHSLLFFNGETGTFQEYIDAKRTEKARTYLPFYNLVDVLRTLRPERFERGQPNLQILFSGNDNIGLRSDKEGSGDFAPVLSFGSIPQNSSAVMGNALQAMPLPPFLPCIGFHHTAHHSGRLQYPNNCNLLPELPADSTSRSWDDLKPQIFWRGSDWVHYLPYYFPHIAPPMNLVTSEEKAKMRTPLDAAAALRNHWDRLQPRWKAVTMSVEAEAAAGASWIDAKFTVQPDAVPRYQPFLDAGAEVVTTQKADTTAHAQYRYHIDLGGGGGTTWSGTITKLFLPGLLFHHETYTKDFFYSEMKPYVHYVPVKQDLSDLKEKFDWCEAHIEDAQRISQHATDLALRLGSEEYIRELYESLFVDQLGKIVDSYRPAEGETIESILAAYEAGGVPLRGYGECDAVECGWGVEERLYLTKFSPVE